MTLVAIHQPNYAPWLGYFVKLARADVFVLLDDAQYSKNSYINRVQIDAGGTARWLTVPVSYSFGDPINRVRTSRADWRQSHLDVLKSTYAAAPHFSAVFDWLTDVCAAMRGDDIAACNEELIRCISSRFAIGERIVRSSGIPVGDLRGDDRLIAILQSFGGDVKYLSGKGGDKYQDPGKFAAAGISIVYNDFVHPVYGQGHSSFLAGLSIFDPLFRLGFDQTAMLVKTAAQRQ